MKSKTLTLISCIALSILLYACSGEKKKIEEQKESSPLEEVAKPKSPAAYAKNTIGNTLVQIDYYSPGVRGRNIYGGLVAYDELWVTGAHSATSIEFSSDVELNGNKISKGKYALFTIPGRTEWTLIINTDYDQHLADNYDQKKDVLRLQLTPEILEPIQEHLLYEVSSAENNEGEISISWSDIKISFRIATL
ncbi:DUF2911 domain-containing protein [Roseivirga echinicomitans]|uniref:DUF2911 domain-containing protein n=1 Tax=Roseivirga echinicomitans TaxID=296218 RepID=A0A150X159_9BACT|nr:DUF2911 domain-containing protein [Roseivirga echinicomitans]KYG72467.1 hypothetical protein AWN68_11960 [Roseivirga echinicomitans]